ncbi:MAG: hypothetical protein SGBAC_002217 [Bacillariaceae sp.]
MQSSSSHAFLLAALVSALLLSTVFVDAWSMLEPTTSSKTPQSNAERLTTSRRHWFQQAIAATSTLATVAAISPLPALAASASSLKEELKTCQSKLVDIPALLEQQEWEKVRQILKTPPVNKLWNLSDSQNVVLQLAKETGDVELFEVKDDLSLALQMTDQLTYDNVFVYFQPGNGKVKIKEPQDLANRAIGIIQKILDDIVKNILQPNSEYHCDIFVHYFHQTQEAVGRYNDGGTIDPNEIFHLKPSVEKLYETLGIAVDQQQNSRLTLLFANDTNTTFYDKRGSDLHRYHTTLDSEGNPKYFPWKTPNWQNSSLDNMIRQWHSIEAVFEMMNEYGTRHNIVYKRVAMLRNDVCYVTPVDIMKLDGGRLDKKNAYFVVPNFAKWPVNDRMIYGPYGAVRVWATQRFRLIEDRVETKPDVGWNMHSERFMKASIVPAMKNLGYMKSFSSDICFFRTRTKGMLMTSDCFQKGRIRGFIKEEKPDIKKIVEETLGRICSEIITDKENIRIQYMYC